SFCWLIFIDGNEIKVQSPNNLGDIALHITYIKNFASGVPLWPENPIYIFSNMRYPAGTDLFNSLLLLVGVDLIRGLIWAAVVASAATCFALYRWGGSFTLAGFLFNGGLAGFQVLRTWKFLDYQGEPTMAWKSLALSMFVTQRGVLYALPAGLLLLYHWRAKYFPTRGATFQVADPAPRKLKTCATPLPFWLELSLYATMPLFHVHTFMALSIVAALFFAVGTREMRKDFATLVGVAFLPATFFMWTITDHFHASSVLKWSPGWVQSAPGEMAMPFVRFWLWNFGAFVPLALLLIGFCVARALRPNERFTITAHPALAFLTPAVVIWVLACLFKTAPWEWDNIKLIIWAYLIMLLFLWSELIVLCPLLVRVAACVALFGSGFVSLFGGLAAGHPGFSISDRGEVEAVGAVVRKVPLDARFASFPNYNHPLLLQGRKVVMGYPGHVWTQGFDYNETEKQLSAVMLGAPDWRDQAQALGARYLFWGREEKANYAGSTRVWEREAQLVASGSWGAIYDLEAAPAGTQSPGQ
ncbi:MAG: hypothetical protein H0U43_05235, partial [Chthoniobacterales bacterium]|nr:hypothetical protein [Chthoniobacterales bacterium]